MARGSSSKENALVRAQSPYLLQHANNPVDWFPWEETALKKAHNEDKLLIISIGYAACHWCHVMEHESFEDEAVATLMNSHFVSIKVDREERPDIDQVYMQALQMLTGQGLALILLHYQMAARCGEELISLKHSGWII